MEIIKDLGYQIDGKWIKHFAMYLCPYCKIEFRANVLDVNIGRKKHCGCVYLPNVTPLLNQYNSIKVKEDLGVIKGRRSALFYCPHCPNTFTKVVSDVLNSRGKLHCGCVIHKANIISPIKPIQPRSNNKNHPLYSTWRGIHNRCYNTNQDNYKNYGGRGIVMCDAWRTSFITFVKDMGERPSSAHTVDRKNNDGMYEPSNCRWATQKEQRSNTRHVPR